MAGWWREEGGWPAEGKIRNRNRKDILDKLGAAPQGLIGLLQGKTFGKLLVRVAQL